MKLHNSPVQDLTKNVLFDDFNYYTTTHLFTTVASDSGTVSVGDAANGVLALVPSDGTVTNNDEVYVKSTKEIFKFANNKPITFEGRVQFTEGATDDVNVAAGMTDAVAANTIADDGAGVKATGSFMGFYKVDGGTVWNCIAIANGTSAGTIATTVTAGGSAYQKLRAEFKPYSSTQANVAYFIDDVHVGSLQLTYTGATEMALFAGIKNGADTTVEQLNVDYLYGSQLR